MTDTSPFASLSNDQSPLTGQDFSQPAPEATFSPDAAQRTARMAAFVNNPASNTDDLTGQINNVTQAYYDEIKSAGDLRIRQEAAANQAAQRLRSLQGVLNDNSDETDPDGSLRTGAMMASQAMIQEGIDQRAKYALEQQTVDHIQDLAASDPTQAKILYNNLQDGDTDQVIRDYNTKQLILQREIEQAGVAKDDQSIVADFADFVMGTAQNLIPFTRGDIGNVDIDQASHNWYDSLFSGDRKMAETDSLWAMPVSQFSDYVKDHLIPNITSNQTFLGYKNNSQIVDTLTSMAHPADPNVANTSDFVNNVGLLAAIKPLKIVTSIPSLLVRNGARTQAVGAVASAMKDALLEGSDVAAEKSGIPQSEVFRAVSPSAINLDGIKTSTVSIASEANEAFAASQKLLEELPNLIQPGRFASDAERQAAIDSNIKAWSQYFSANATLKDVTPVVEKSLTGQDITHLQLTLGRKTGGGFATQEEAEGFARSLSLPSSSALEIPYPRVEGVYEGDELSRFEWESARDDSGQYFARLKAPMKETGLYTNPLEPKSKTWIGGYLKRANHIGDEWLASLARVSGNTRQKMTSFLKGRMSNINSLDRDSKLALGQVLEAGRQNKVWLSDEQLSSTYQRAFNREPTAKEVDAYRDYRALNDLDFALRRESAYNQRALKGYNTVSIRTKNVGEERVNGVVDRDPKSVTGRVYDSVNDKHYPTGMSDEEVKGVTSKGGILVKLEQTTKTTDGYHLRQVIVSPKDLEVEPLRRDQIGYTPGGHIIYDDNYFVKQGKTLTQPDGSKILVAPKTFIGASTTAEGRFFAQKMEVARLLAKGGETRSTTFDKLFGGSPGFPSGDEFLSAVKSGAISLEHPFEVVGDRELPSVYHEQGRDLQFVDQDSTQGLSSLMQAQGRSFWSARGEDLLRDYKGDLAPTLDPYKTLNLALGNISRLISFADYKEIAIARWADTFRRYTSMAGETSDWKVFKNGLIDKSVPYEIRQGAENQRTAINTVLGWTSDYDYHAQYYAKRLADWVGGDSPEGLRNSLAKGVLWWNKNVRPLDSVRGLVFDAKMGFWNPVQVPIHLGNSYAALTLSPQYGMAALKNSWFAGSFLASKDPEGWLSDMVGRGAYKKLGFKTGPEFRSYMNYLKDSGMAEIVDSNNMINEFGPTATMSSFGNSIQNTREAGRSLLHWSWKTNKLIASSLAWQELRDKFPGMAVDSQDFLNRFAARTEEYDFNFSKESRAAWQRGWTSIPTQFFGYWTGLLEAVAGDQFTTRQKINLALGQMFLAGTAGAPIISVADSLYAAKGGVPAQAHPDTFFGGLRRGALDEIIYGITGADVKAGARIGVGDELTNVVQDLFGFGDGADKSFMDVAGGASWTTMNQASKNLSSIIKHSMMETGNDAGTKITKDVLLGMAKNINTVSNITKALSIFHYGNIMSTDGQTVMADDVPAAEGYMQALGFQPYEQTYMNNLFAYQKDSSAAVNDATKTLQAYRQRFALEPDNRDDLSAQINAFMATMPPDVRTKAIRRANRFTPQSVYKSLSDQVQREQMEKQIVQGIQDNQ